MPVHTLTEPQTVTIDTPVNSPVDGDVVRTAPGDLKLMPGPRAAVDDEQPFGPRRVALTIGLLLTIVGVAFEALAVA
ncbi:MAG: hypothetical protein H0V00_07000, partial [Chloroflexia bacterium]|nr:hypothetical protein [Chloroflexia bacterium]